MPASVYNTEFVTAFQQSLLGLSADRADFSLTVGTLSPDGYVAGHGDPSKRSIRGGTFLSKVCEYSV